MEGQERRRESPGRESTVSTSQKGERGTGNGSSLRRRQRDKGADLRMGTKSNGLLHGFVRLGGQDSSPVDRYFIPSTENQKFCKGSAPFPLRHLHAPQLRAMECQFHTPKPGLKKSRKAKGGEQSLRRKLRIWAEGKKVAMGRISARS